MIKRTSPICSHKRTDISREAMQKRTLKIPLSFLCLLVRPHLYTLPAYIRYVDTDADAASQHFETRGAPPYFNTTMWDPTFKKKKKLMSYNLMTWIL